MLDASDRLSSMTASIHPLISVGLPVLNCERTVKTAIRSILQQTYSNWELLLIDDGSTDMTVEIARSFKDVRIRVIADGVHKGLPVLLNEAISLSTGEFFARMDGDDVSYPERLALQVEYLEHHPQIDLLGGSVLVFGHGGQPLGTRKTRISHAQICGRPWAGFDLAHPTWMGRMEWFRKHHYRSDAGRCCDQDLLLRTYESSCFAVLPEIVLGYREEKLSLRKILADRRSFMWSVVREAISKRQYAIAAAAIIEQALKGLTDCVAIGTGLGYRILRHRALSVEEATKRRWIEVWEEVQIEHQAARKFSVVGSGQQ
jgi:glycosyltransferase involved in cell wall biosynthesis